MRTYRMRDVLTQRLREEWCDVLNARPPERFSDLLDRLRRPKRRRNRYLSKKVRCVMQPTGPYSGSRNAASHVSEVFVADEGVASCVQQHNQRQEVLAMINASKIKEHMEVKGSDGKHIGTVLGVENGHLKLASGGIDHDIDIGMVEAVEDDAIMLSTTAEETVRTWH